MKARFQDQDFEGSSSAKVSSLGADRQVQALGVRKVVWLGRRLGRGDMDMRQHRVHPGWLAETGPTKTPTKCWSPAGSQWISPDSYRVIFR
jgi:hypothetical protein